MTIVINRHHPQPCPACGHTLDASTGVTHQAAPTVGDYTVCLNCATPLLFGDGLALSVADLTTCDRELAEELGQAIRIAKRARLNRLGKN